MAVTILIPTALRQFTQNFSEVEVEALSVEEALGKLKGLYPDLKKHIFADDNTLRNFVNVYVNEDDIRQKDGIKTTVKEGDTIMLIPSIAGGTDLKDEPLSFSKEEITRYSRHLILPEVGLEGQKRLKNAKVLLVGSGGLGAPIALYLAAAGIGTIGIVDFDEVDVSNLQRQIIHTTKDIGRPKIASAADKIKAINPHVKVLSFNTKLSSGNALDIIKDFDAVADCTDNFPTRYLVNDACVILGKPSFYGSIYRFDGQASVFYAKKGPCYRCLYPSPPPSGFAPSCAEGGVLGVLPGIVGCIQANEIIKFLLGAKDLLIGRLLTFDAWKIKFREFKIQKDENCPICGKHPSIKDLIDYEDFCGLKSEAGEIVEEISAEELKNRLENKEAVNIIDIREPHEYAIAKLPNSKIIPLGQVVRRMEEIDPKNDTIFVCKVGTRSVYAIRALKEAGFEGRLLNLKNGVLAWAQNVDKEMAVY
ncbi:MAG: molybdopterin-synthase adenylyltransferase MoeB [Campylobacteraceae bacterium]|jgi:adenylyltransferase/sulfurtransferase|nr:molybdopterin-synthase adenylyltransferase MoeB [Campylobacteraceae bacterium]